MLSERIASGLKRKTITSCSRWAENYRVMGKPYPGKWTFDHHPWVREMHDCDDNIIVGQKAAQMGFTEVALNKVFYEIDVNATSCLYILPASTPDAKDFSSARFDPALELSSHLQNLFSDVKNVGHKRAGSANLFIRGTRSPNHLKSLPVGFIVADELDEMVQKHLALASERLSGQVEKQEFKISTPTIDDFGINAEYRRSTQDHFFFKCPRCSRLIELIFPECMVITSDDPDDIKIKGTYIVCSKCKGRLEHEDKINFLKNGIWVPAKTDKMIRGFHINQMYSMSIEPYELARLYLTAQTNPSDEQEFFNSKLGLTHVVEGASVTDSELVKCQGSHKKTTRDTSGSLITMGVDVGKFLHFEICKWHIDTTKQTSDINIMSTAIILNEGKVSHFEELDLLMRDFNITFCVIDANPERRKALEFAQRFWGSVRLCFYTSGLSGKAIKIHPEHEHTISVDRTSWLDLSLARFMRTAIKLPVDTSFEYKAHIKSLVRIYSKDASGNPVGKYTKGNVADHFAHARNYCEIALSLGANLGASHNIEGVL